MARRIDIELTSSRSDGSWTWRAAGALQPRGVLDGLLLHEGAKPGDVLKADAEFEIDGISIIAVLAPREKHRSEAQRIELLAPSRTTPGVTTQLAGRSDRRGPGREERRGPRPERAGGYPARADRRPERDDRDRGRPQPANRSGDRPSGGDRSGGDGGPPDGSAGAAQRDGPRGLAGRRPGGGEDGERSRRSPAEARRSRPAGADHTAPGRERNRPETGTTAGVGGASRGARRLSPGNAHRRAVLESLAPEERSVAEQVLRGGIPAVRTAIHLEREKATAQGRPAPHAESLIALAESLLPRLKAAEWRDRAEAAAAAGDDISLRDLRSAVAGADVARDDDARALAASLRDRLEARLDRLREDWAGEIARHLEEHRVVRALRLSARPPEPTARLDAELASRLTEAAGAAMAPDTAPDRWAALLEAVVASPVRRNVKPVGLPADPGEPLLGAARQQVGRVPALAPLIGISMPPPPGPARPGGAPATRGRVRPVTGGAAPRRQPPRRDIPAGDATTAEPVGSPPEDAPAEDAPPPASDPTRPARGGTGSSPAGNGIATGDHHEAEHGPVATDIGPNGTPQP